MKSFASFESILLIYLQLSFAIIFQLESGEITVKYKGALILG